MVESERVQVVIRFPQHLVDKINGEAKKKGLTRNTLINTIVQDWLENEGVFRFKHFNVYNDHFTLYDETQEMLIDVFIRDGKLICALDDNMDCVHVKFCYTLPEAKTLVKKGLIRSM